MDKDELSFAYILNYLWKEKFTIVVLSFSIAAIIFSIIFVNSTIKSKEKYMVLPSAINKKVDNLVANDLQSSTITETEKSVTLVMNKFITPNNIRKAIDRSNLKISENELVKLISITRGEENINNLSNLLSDANSSRIIRQLSIDESALSQIFADITSFRDLFFQINLNYSKTKLNKIQGKIFLENMLSVINEEITILYNENNELKIFENLTAKNNLDINSISEIYHRYYQLMLFYNQLAAETNIVTAANMNEIQSMASMLQYKISVLINSEDYVKEYFQSVNKLKIENMEQKISVIDQLLLKQFFKGTDVFSGSIISDQSSFDQNETGAVSIDNDIFNRLLNLGSDINFTNFRKKLILEKRKLHFEKADFEEFDKLILGNDSILIDKKIETPLDIYFDVVNGLNIYGSKINEVSNARKELRTFEKTSFLSALGGAYIVGGDKSILYNLNSNLITSFLFGLALSIFLVISKSILITDKQKLSEISISNGK